MLTRQLFGVALEHIGNEVHRDRRCTRNFLLKPGLGALCPWQGNGVRRFLIAQCLYLLEQLDVDLHVAALAGRFLGDLFDHGAHELGDGFQSGFGLRRPWQPAGGHGSRGLFKTRLATHLAHHLPFELGEDLLSDLAVTQLAGFFLR